jgi:hypothetical protein
MSVGCTEVNADSRTSCEIGERTESCPTEYAGGRRYGQRYDATRRCDQNCAHGVVDAHHGPGKNPMLTGGNRFKRACVPVAVRPGGRVGERQAAAGDPKGRGTGCCSYAKQCHLATINAKAQLRRSIRRLR